MHNDPINVAYTPQLSLLYCGRAVMRRWQAENVCVPYWRLYWNDRSGAYLNSATESYALTPEYFLLVAPNTTLSRALHRPVEHFFTHFTVGLPFARIQGRVHRFKASPLFVAAMRRDYTVTRVDTPASDIPRRTATALALCWYALATLPSEYLPAHPPDLRIHRLLEWWAAHDWQPTGNKELATRLGMHPAAFCRRFRSIMGMPPQIFGQIRRMDRACLLLHFSDLSIKQIAADTGFGDRYYFSRRFRQLRGIAPAAFRRQADKVGISEA